MYKNVSENYRKTIYDGSSRNMPKLSIGGVEIPPTQISRIVIESPIIDTKSDVYYLGTFISQKLTITFRDVSNVPLNGDVYLEIGKFVDGDYEYVPIGYFIIDDGITDFYNKKELTCLDRAILFKPNVDYSPALVEDKITFEDLLKWLCDYYKVELGGYPETHPNAKKTISTYDNTISGKTYISWIAENLGGNAKMGRDGKLYILPLISEPVTTINALRGKSWKIGERYKIGKVIFSNGSLYKECIDDTSDENANTLYLRNSNLFIQEEDFEERVTNIFDSVKSFEIYNVECENYGDLTLDCWDIVTYALDENTSYNTYYNSTITYDMTIMAQVQTKVPSKQAEDTTNFVKSDNDTKIKRVQTTVDQQNGKITQMAEQVDGQDTKINQLETSVNGIQASVTQQINDAEGNIKDEVNGQLDLYIKKNDKDEVVSAFNLNSNEVVITSDNFKLDAKGNITARSATLNSTTINTATANNLTINSGSIELEDSNSEKPRIIIEDSKHNTENSCSIFSRQIHITNGYIGSSTKNYTVLDGNVLMAGTGDFESIKDKYNKVPFLAGYSARPVAHFKSPSLNRDEETGINLVNSEGITTVSMFADGNIVCRYLRLNYAPTASYHAVRLYDLQNWTCDERYKKNIKDSNYNALEKILNIKHKEFDFKYGGHVENGYIADELEEIDKSFIIETGEEKIKQPQISSLIPAITKAIQEQQELIKKLEIRIEELEKGK